jgi:hypothetical protein
MLFLALLVAIICKSGQFYSIHFMAAKALQLYPDDGCVVIMQILQVCCKYFDQLDWSGI